MARQFVTDLEGPITLNDNALELCKEFIPQGESFFSQISRYDDYLSDVVHRKGYQAGDTLKLILPFLKAYRVTDQKMKKYSRDHVVLLPKAAETLRKIAQEMPTFIISTSYQAYLEAVCEKIDFPLEKAYFTRVELDRVELDSVEARKIQALRREIGELSPIAIPAGASSLADFTLDSQRTIKRIDEIFGEQIPRMKIGRLFFEVRPVGAVEKTKALRDTLKKTGNSLREVFYVGDSITDAEALKLTNKAGGLSLSFNGNRHTLAAAEVACISKSASVLVDLADVFRLGGRTKILEFISDRHALAKNTEIIRLERISGANRKKLTEESESFRQKLRGKAGILG